MNSNRLLNIFGLRRKISREDIDAYNRTNDPIAKNELEQDSLNSSFDNDAMEGWEDLSYDTSTMQRLDKKFAGSSSASIYWSIGIVVLVIVGLVGFNYISSPSEPIANQDTTVSEPSDEVQTLTIDETDIIVPVDIENMQEVAEVEQFQPEQIKEQFAEMNEIKEEKNNTSEEDVVGGLPTIDPEVPLDMNIISSRFSAKEIYLSEMKLVDYRSYRTKPTVETKQYLLSGTPADQEVKGGESDIDATPQIVDVPYIDYIEKTMRIFNRGNFKKALSRFEIILDTYDDDVNANFYAGLCLYNFGEYTLAIEHFQKCKISLYLNFDEEVQWLTGLSYEHMGSDHKAQKIFEEIVSSNGFYSDQAKAKL